MASACLSSGLTAPAPAPERGFTLIELLVALAVLSIAALALVKLMTVTVLTTAGVETRALGGIVAENLAAEALTDDPPPALGKDSGVVQIAGRSFGWTRVVASAAEAGMTRIDLAVAADDGTPAATLTLFRGQ
jgi:general secretion pathway protein I